jgi:hypothetical protein
MNQPYYDFQIFEDAFRFEFESTSSEKTITKAILFQRTNLPNYYNLTLADILPDGSNDIFSKSNNGDLEKILSTVIQTILVFLAYHPPAKVVFTGSTPSRTRLYQIVLSKELDNVNEKLEVVGFTDEKIEPFQRNQSYLGFIISNKVQT